MGDETGKFAFGDAGAMQVGRVEYFQSNLCKHARKADAGTLSSTHIAHQTKQKSIKIKI